MAASPLSVVFKGDWPNLDGAHLCAKAVKWVAREHIGTESEKEAPARFAYTVWSAGQWRFIAC